MREMQDPENGVPVRSQKLFLTSIPAAFMGKFSGPFCMEKFSTPFADHNFLKYSTCTTCLMPPTTEKK